MNIIFSKNKQINLENELTCNSYNISYSLNLKTYFFENTSFYLFLKTNYSEYYVDSILANTNSLTKLDIKKAFYKDGVWLIIDKKNNTISVNRDVAGLNSLYYYIKEDYLQISSNVHLVAKENSKKLDKHSVYQLLYFDYLWDGQTLYDNITQLKIGGEIQINSNLSIEKISFKQPKINQQENELSTTENIKKLRIEIVNAHKRYVNKKNIVFLSGGIDSVAMLIALDDLTDKSTIKSHSFRVKGTTQDETIYAKSIANHLEIDLSIVERDISNEINKEIFIDTILKMNNPYPGIWTFANQVNNNNFQSYFAGQDTRLHTPSLNILDELAFNIFNFSKKGLFPFFYILNLLLYPLKKLANILLTKKHNKNKFVLGLRRALYLFDIESYIRMVYFKIDKTIIKNYGLPIEYFDSISKKYKFSIEGVKNKRSLYNRIVELKWIEQYAFDMRYMVDMVNKNDAKLAMPFYDMDLANFSATIPFNLATKTMKGKEQFGDKKNRIYKYVLRESLVDKIDKKTYLRSKAVSRIGHLAFNQGLGEILKNIFVDDLNSKNSIVKQFKFEKFIEVFMNQQKKWTIPDDKYLLKIYYLACIIIYDLQLE